MADSLTQRLKLLRQSQSKTRQTASDDSTEHKLKATTSRSTGDEANELIAKLRDELAIEENHSESWQRSGSETDDSLEELLTLAHEAESRKRDRSSIDHDEVHGVISEGHGLRAEAEQLLQQHSALLKRSGRIEQSSPLQVVRSDALSVPEVTPEAGKLQLKARPRPILFRSSTGGTGQDYSDAEQDLDLSRELADAFSADVHDKSHDALIGTAPRTHRDVAQGSPSTPMASERKTDASDLSQSSSVPQEDGNDLALRFAALRAEHLGVPLKTSTSQQPSELPEDEKRSSLDFLSSMPSVPSTIPTTQDVESSQPTHPSLGSEHNDIPADRDLDPFRELVGKRLDVSRLALHPPKSKSGSADGENAFALPSPPSSDRSEDEPGHIFCSLCADGASLKCCPPGCVEGFDDGDDDSPAENLEGCAGDAYCSSCWVEAHSGMDRDELRDHRTKNLPPARRRGQGKKTGRAGQGSGADHKRSILA